MDRLKTSAVGQRVVSYVAQRSPVWGATYLRHRSKILWSVYMLLFLSNFAGVGSKRSKKKVRKEEEKEEKKAEREVLGSAHAIPDKKVKSEINREFYLKFKRVVKVMFPNGLRSKEFWLLCLHTMFLIMRSVISLYVANLDGKLVSDLVRGKGRAFLWGIVWWMVVSVPATFTNSILSYLQCILALRYRNNLTQHIVGEYLPTSGNPVYYSIHNLDDRIKNADQLIAVDVQRLSHSVSHLYSNLAKPTLDMFLYSWSLSRNLGGEGMILVGFLIQGSAVVMRALTPPFGRYAATEAALEGEFRHEHTRLIEYAEEVALYNGQEHEKTILDRGYFALIKHKNRILVRRLYHSFMEDFIIKYFWGALGLALCSIPIFFKVPGMDVAAASVAGSRTEKFVTNRRMLLSCSDAFGRIMFSYKEIAQLSGYTARVVALMDVMEDIKHGNYDKHQISGDHSDPRTEKTLSSITESSLVKTRYRDPSEASGKTIIGTDIIFDRVPVVSPSGDVLVPELSFEVKYGRHLLIVGPNGCGKSSLFRILGGLWPVYAGTLTKPPSSDIFYIPQRPYLSRGTLRQQVIYPSTEAENKASDNELLDILKIVKIDHIVEAVGGWDAEREWREDLSMGVQQRIAMARLFYHKPKFAILDECTSSVTADMEYVMYTHSQKLGISLLSVSHRTSLWKYHDLILQFDGQGGYLFGDLDPEERLKIEEESRQLDAYIRSVPDMEERLAMLKASVNM